MGIIPLIKFILSHPLNKKNKIEALFRFVKWQINTRLNPYPVLYPITNKAKLLIQRGMTGATGNIYCGLHDFNEMGFVLHFLQPGDLFIDAGANIGSYSILAAAHAGANVVAFEPAPDTYSHLEQNILVNKIQDKIWSYNIALGSVQGEVFFSKNHDTANHVLNGTDEQGIKVKLEKLDNFSEKFIHPMLLKIDVEGYETEVLNGAAGLLSNDNLKAIIIELNGSGNIYGYNESAIHKKLISQGFYCYQYHPFERKLLQLDKYGTINTIYIRDVDFITGRLNEANKVEILGNKF